MKTRPLTRACLLLSMAALTLTFSPLVKAQTPSNPPTNSAAPDSDQSTKTTDSTAEQQGGTTPVNSGSQEKTDSKSTSLTNAVDANPSNASTGNGQQTTTKVPSDATTQNTEAAGETHHHKGSPDKMFVMAAAQGGMTEVELGKLASEKGSSSKVKDFGARMVKDHTKINDRLKAVADSKGFTVPDSLNSKHQAVVDRFSKLSGSEFDKAYVDEMVTAHEHDAAAFQKEIDTTQDPDLKAFATKALKTIKMHLSMIKDIQSSM